MISLRPLLCWVSVCTATAVCWWQGWLAGYKQENGNQVMVAR